MPLMGIASSKSLQDMLPLICPSTRTANAADVAKCLCSPPSVTLSSSQPRPPRTAVQVSKGRDPVDILPSAHPRRLYSLGLGGLVRSLCNNVSKTKIPSNFTPSGRRREIKCRLTSPRGILEQRDVHGAGGQVDVAHHGPADEDVLDGAEVGVAQLLVDRDVVELDVEVLVDRLERARHLDVVLELDGDGLVD